MAGRATIIIPLVIASIVLWELAVPTALILTRPGMPELSVYAVDKIGFAAALALALTFAHAWRSCGFGGGLPARGLKLLWPIWLGTAAALIQGVANPDPVRLLGWLAVAAAVAFGEEGIFRGIVIAALRPQRQRRAAWISATLFGVVHLAGLASPLDPRIVVLQAIAAGGLGLVLAGTRLLTGSIWPGLLAHAALDFFGLIAADGVVDAMPDSAEEYVFLLATAAISIGWGLVLWRRLPPDQPLEYP
ncbi:MAG TPA: CPBP family intramembrane glutamic endopeptidase [Aliidongia sp.]|nr:CPBP family intramembrane glutamic endopeptidase [Aliidongia sp.]